MAAPKQKIPIDTDGRFSGYASLFNTLDAGGDIVMPGAFAASLVKRRGRIRLLFQH
ncbi:MAG: HK97 family phage prohead protease, partial [Devosia sp.]